MIQTIIIAILSLAAIAYLGNMVYKSFTSNTCETGCGKCGVANINAVVDSIDKKKGQD